VTSGAGRLSGIATFPVTVCPPGGPILGSAREGSLSGAASATDGSSDRYGRPGRRERALDRDAVRDVIACELLDPGDHGPVRAACATIVPTFGARRLSAS
jgi:hypothetical protein